MTAAEMTPDGVRTRAIEAHLPLVRAIAARFTGRGETYDELVGVGSLALVTAIDRARPHAPATLGAYVARCVEGEIRRHLRDRSSVVRVPRRIRAEGLQPTFAPLDADDELADGARDERAEDVALTRALVASASRCLDGRERRALALRYFLDLSQREVGEEIGVSQVQVSRLLRAAGEKMRARLGEDASAAAW